MGTLIDITGKRFGRLIVIEQIINPDRLRNSPSIWLCRCDCGKEVKKRSEDLRSGKSKSCGCYRKEKLHDLYAGRNSLSWKGGKYQRKDGYVLVLNKNHSRADKRGYVLEHILVMETVLGRPVIHNEAIHHINGVKHDNRPENLRLYENAGEHLRLHRLGLI